MPGLREWGAGLEKLAECYFKYVKKCIVEVGRTFQKSKKISHPKGDRVVPYPHDIDLIAVNLTKRRVNLVSCSEDWDKTAKETEEEFKLYEDFARNSEDLRFGKSVKIERSVACVTIGETRKQELGKRGIAILEAGFMLEELLGIIKKERAKKRKGARREPLMWLLQTLDRMGKISYS